LTLVREDLTRGNLDLLRERRDAVQLLGRARLEQRHVPQPVDDRLAPRRHTAAGPRGPGRLRPARPGGHEDRWHREERLRVVEGGDLLIELVLCDAQLEERAPQVLEGEAVRGGARAAAAEDRRAQLAADVVEAHRLELAGEAEAELAVVPVLLHHADDRL